MLRISILLILSFLLGCKPAGKENPTQLVDGFQSYSSPEQIQNLLTSMEIDWEVKSKHTIPEQKDMPEVEVLELVVPNYSDSGVTGRLEFGFFDNQLVGTGFYPDDWDKYKLLLEHQFNQNVKIKDEFDNSIRTRVSILKDYQDNVYISWKDTELSKKAFNRSLKQH